MTYGEDRLDTKTKQKSELLGYNSFPPGKYPNRKVVNSFENLMKGIDLLLQEIKGQICAQIFLHTVSWESELPKTHMHSLSGSTDLYYECLKESQKNPG